MKKFNILSALAIGLGMLSFTACEDDNDSNPEVLQPKTFELNVPALGENMYDLESTPNIKVTYKQPAYGFTAAVTYYAQVSLDDTWEEADEENGVEATYIELDGSTTTCEYEIQPYQVNRFIIEQNGYADESEIPADGISLYVRIRATLQSGYECISNSISLNVLPYYMPLTQADPEIWYLIGGNVGDGSWTNNGTDNIGTSLVPMCPIDGSNYDAVSGQGPLTYTGYFTAAGGFKIIKTPGKWDYQWGSDGNGGYRQKDASGEGSDITVPADGYYTIELDTKNNTLSVTPAEEPARSYEVMCIAGAFNGWVTDETMTAVNTAAGNNHVWRFELDASSGDTELKFLANYEWTFNWGATGFPYGFGTGNGANILVVAGEYTIVFNDITGYYHFYSK